MVQIALYRSRRKADANSAIFAAAPRKLRVGETVSCGGKHYVADWLCSAVHIEFSLFDLCVEDMLTLTLPQEDE